MTKVLWRRGTYLGQYVIPTLQRLRLSVLFLYQTNISCSMAMSSRRICNRARVLKVLVVGTQRRSRDVGIFCVAVDACGSNPNRGDSNTSFGSRGASKKF